MIQIDERQAEGDVGDDQPGLRVVEPDAAHHQQDRDRHRDRRHEAEAEDRRRPAFLAAEAVAREGVGRRHAEDQGDGHGAAGDDDRVDDEVEEVALEQHVGVVLADHVPVEVEARRHLEDVDPPLGRQQGEVDERGDAEQPDDDEDEVLHDAHARRLASAVIVASSRRMSTRFSSTERRDGGDDHHDVGDRRREAVAGEAEPVLEAVEAERRRRAARPAVRQAVDEVERAEGVDRPEDRRRRRSPAPAAAG